MSPQLNIKELHNIQKKKLELKHVAYDHIIELIHRRIKLVASFGGTNTFYEIPGLVVGYPLYNLIHCTTYIMESLRKNGLLVQLLPPPHISVLYISWDKKDVRPALPAPIATKHKIESDELKKIKQLRLF